MATSGSTWAATHHFAAPRLVRAASAADVAVAVAESTGPVRALGTRHSFHDIADTEGTLITLVDAPAQAVINGDLVTVNAGTRYGELALWLQERGRALHNLGSLPHISVAGATQTGTHGSGVTNGSLSTAVRSFEWVDATGAIRVTQAGDAEFPALVVGLGAFGIITRITLATEPAYDMIQEIHNGIAWDALLADPDAILAAAYSVSVFARWGEPDLEQVWIKRRVDRDLATASGWGGSLRTEPTTLVDGDPADLTEQTVVGPWLHRLPHFRLDGTPSNGDEIQTEYFVARSDAAAALAAVRELAASIDPLLYITELRTVAADHLWLSGAQGRATLAIHFTWRNLPQQVAAILPHIEAALAPFEARPHWGKWHHFDADRIAAVYPRLPEARAVFARLDPHARFSNAHLRRLGVR